MFSGRVNRPSASLKRKLLVKFFQKTLSNNKQNNWTGEQGHNSTALHSAQSDAVLVAAAQRNCARDLSRYYTVQTVRTYNIM